MSWIKMDDKLHRNPKARESSDAAFKVWILSWSYCGDMPEPTGFLSTTEAEGFVRSLGKPIRVIGELIQRHMWDAVEGGVIVHEFEQGLPQKSTAKVRAWREKKRLQEVASAVTATAMQPLQQRLHTVSSHARAVPEPDPVPVGEQRDQELSLVVQGHMSAVNGGPLSSSPRQRVFAAWQRATGKLRAKLDGKRAALIDRALKTYPEDELIDAVRGWRHSPHHRGENDRATIYNDLDVLLRDAKHIEEFRDLERQGSTGRVVAKSQSQQLGDSFRQRAAALREQGS